MTLPASRPDAARATAGGGRRGGRAARRLRRLRRVQRRGCPRCQVSSLPGWLGQARKPDRPRL